MASSIKLNDFLGEFSSFQVCKDLLLFRPSPLTVFKMAKESTKVKLATDIGHGEYGFSIANLEDEEFFVTGGCNVTTISDRTIVYSTKSNNFKEIA